MQDMKLQDSMGLLTTIYSSFMFKIAIKASGQLEPTKTADTINSLKPITLL